MIETSQVISTVTSGTSMKSLEGVEPKVATIEDFRLKNGEILPSLQVAYETYGTLAPSRDNVVLITHGYAGHQHAAGHYATGKALPWGEAKELGWWDYLIGPGRAIDTNRFFVVSSNTLGSSYGTTGPASINPKTGKPYGPDFPHVTITDMVNTQRALLTQLGVKRLLAIVGYSYGGYQAFQWAVTCPEMVKGIVVASSSPKGNGNPKIIQDLISKFSQHPNWNCGQYYDRGGIKNALVDFRIEMLKFFGLNEESYAPETPPITIREMAEQWADTFDANSLIALRRAAEYRDAEKDFDLIKAKVLYVLCASDNLFPPSVGTAVMAKLISYKIDAEYFELDSNKGHVGVLYDAAKWESVLRAFLARLQNQ